MQRPSHQIHFFDEFALDLTRGCLQHGPSEIKLRPQSFEVLKYLVENCGRLISKDELISAIWAGAAVTDGSLVQCLKDIRHALCDRHHGTDRRSAAGPAQQMDVGLPEILQRGLGIARGIEIEHDLTVLKRLLLEDGFEQRAFVGEVDVKRALGDLRRAGDLAHAGAVKPEIHEHLAGPVQDLAAFGAVLLLDDVQMFAAGYNHWFRVSESFCIAPGP